MQATAMIEEAVARMFEQLDAEAWDELAGELHADVELADELTGEWLRGRERVAGYLEAQRGIVAGIRSRLRSVEARWLSPELGLATFVCEQHYLLGDVEHHESLTGATIVSFDGTDARLLLFHLGAQSGAHAPSDELARELAEPETAPRERLRQRRRERGLSLRALGERTGLSASFLSQVERGAAEPSVASLVRLAQALDLPVGELLDRQPAVPRASERLVRADARRRVNVPASPLELELLSDAAARELEVTVFQLRPGESGPRAAERGERFLHLLEGRLRVTCDREDVLLAPGDSLTIAAGTAYAVAAEKAGPLRCLSVLARPRAQQDRSQRGGDDD